MIPVEVTIDDVVFSTSLFPQGDTYLLPLKLEVRRKTNITAGDAISVQMTIRKAER
jgi:hypothetical protein